MHNWHRGSYNIKLRNGEVEAVDGVVLSGVLPSLGVHNTSPGVYDVTHIPSGTKVTQPGFYSFHQAMAFAEAIIKSHAWGQVDPGITSDDQQMLRVIAAEFRT
jgi:hypothetical protein